MDSCRHCVGVTTTITPLPGLPFPLGAIPIAGGTNFAVASEVADSIEICLFADDGTETQVQLTERTAHVFHGGGDVLTVLDRSILLLHTT
jgi:pullulanase/glycogen debranching enzyme